MTWAKFDDAFYSHPKAERIGLDGCGLLLLSVTYSCHQLTDGEISREWARRYGKPAVVRKLLEHGVWEETDEGYVVHDFLKYNPSKAEVGESRALAVERMRRVRSQKRSQEVRANIDRTSQEVRVPRTRRVRSSGSSDVGGSPKALALVPMSSPSQATAVREIYDHWKTARGKNGHAKLTPLRRKKIQQRLREGFSVEQLCRAIDGVANDPWEERSQHDALEVILRSPEQVEKFLNLAENPPDGMLDPKAAYLRERAARETE